MGRNDYNSIKSWYIGWGNWESCTSVSLEETLKDEDESKKGGAKGI
jgi:hypothetical protein